MAATSNQFYTSLQSYWRRKAYRRLEGSASTSKKTVRLGGDDKRGKRISWKVGALRKVLRIRVLRIPSPKRLLLRMRDAYVNAMLALAGGVPSANGGGKRLEAVWGKRIPKAREAAPVKGVGDFEMRMILHVYNTVMSAPRELTSCV